MSEDPPTASHGHRHRISSLNSPSRIERHLQLIAHQVGSVTVLRAEHPESALVGFPDREARRFDLLFSTLMPAAMLPGMLRLSCQHENSLYHFSVPLLRVVEPARWAVGYPNRIERSGTRNAPRYPLSHNDDFRIRLEASANVRFHPLHDLSQGGLSFYCTGAPPGTVGTQLRATLCFPVPRPVALPAIVEVRHARRQRDRHIVGCVIRKIAPISQTHLEQVISHVAQHPSP